MADIKVTLETLYDILRNEKKKEDLQQLDNSFFVDVVAYLREKKALLEDKSDQDELFASTEREKLEYELRSIKRILKEIYEKREKKIIDIAMNKSRTRSDIIDTSCMLREEKEFFDSLVEHLDKYRSGVLLNLFKGNLPFVDKDFSAKKLLDKESAVALKTETTPGENTLSEQEPKETSDTVTESEKENSTEPSTNSFSKFEGVEAPAPDTEPEEADEPEEEETTETEETPEEQETEPEQKKTPVTEQEQEKTEPKTKTKKEETPKQEMTKIKFVHPVPRFIWKDMKEYGPFDPGEETKIFPEVAELLVRKGRAEKV